MTGTAERMDAGQGAPSESAHLPSASFRGVLDVLVYAPIGFALSAGTLVPELAAKGRARAQEQVRLARMIGEFAVPIARRKGERLVREQVARATRTAREASRTRPPTTSEVPSKPVARSVAAPPAAMPVVGPTVEPAVAPPRVSAATKTAMKAAAKTAKTATKTAATTTRAKTKPPADPMALPIEGYDALPASSIVTLLEGLRPAQLRALDAHERANRGRRTVLTRIAQLLA